MLVSARKPTKSTHNPSLWLLDVFLHPPTTSTHHHHHPSSPAKPASSAFCLAAVASSLPTPAAQLSLRLLLRLPPKPSTADSIASATILGGSGDSGCHCVLRYDEGHSPFDGGGGGEGESGDAAGAIHHCCCGSAE